MPYHQSLIVCVYLALDSTEGQQDIENQECVT